MKCPNCSFENSDDSKQCKICGYDLPIKITPPSKKFVEDDDDGELDSALKSLFGLDEEIKTEDDEDPLDVATVERMLHRKKQPTNEHVGSSGPTRQTPERKETKPSTKEDDDNEVPQYSLKVIFIVIAILILLAIIFKTGLIKLPWKYQNEQNTTQAITTEVTTESTEATTEVVINLGSEAQLAPVNTFYDYLPEFVNKGNLNILTLFKSSQEALDLLTTFSSEGNIETIHSAKLTASEMNESDATFTVDTIMDRLIEGKQTKMISTWDFHIVLDKASWYIDSLGVTSQEYSDVPSETTSSQETTAETSQETTAATTAPATTAPVTTEPALFDYTGFIASGSFSGGKASTGQDVGSARYGDHDDFERIAFDVFKWNGGNPQDTVDEITSYTATISADGKKITINLTGAIDAYASLKPLELGGSPNVESIKYSLSGPNESVQIDIVLKNASQFKVFNLKSPARLVVDIAIK
ncbi:AMIN-like domain-containing (lipo)protein [Fusibacter bizertensis]